MNPCAKRSPGSPPGLRAVYVPPARYSQFDADRQTGAHARGRVAGRDLDLNPPLSRGVRD